MLEKMTLQEAGELLGISPDAVRMRIKRGKIRVVDIKQTEVWDDTC